MTRAVSLRASVFGLALSCVAAAQAISLVVLSAFPASPPPPVTPAAAAAAFLSPAAAVRVGLRRRELDVAPFPQDAKPYTRLVAATLQGRVGEAGLSELRVRSLSDAVSLRSDGLPPAALFVRRAWNGDAPALAAAPFPSFAAAARRSDGRWIVVEPPSALISPEHLRIAVAFGLSVCLLAPLTWWSARRLTQPLQRLARASQSLGRDPGAPPLRIAGPHEVRAACTAFNAMQADLARHMDERATLMASIAHDLRTPLTSLRLRAETAPEPDRARMALDIARLEALVSDLLLFARGGRIAAPRARLDLGAVARAVVDTAAAGGARVELSSPACASVLAEPAAVRRSIENLVGNAVNYAGSAQVRVGDDGALAWVEVADEGPGIAPEALETVFQPFVRLEASRSRNTGGVGLGLAIARSIARAHGGDVELSLRHPRGLVARFTLPSTAAQARR